MTSGPAETPPDIPTVGEFLPGYEASGWYGIGAPSGNRHASPLAISSASPAIFSSLG
jgi:hypothetical protein